MLGSILVIIGLIFMGFSLYKKSQLYEQLPAEIFSFFSKKSDLAAGNGENEKNIRSGEEREDIKSGAQKNTKDNNPIPPRELEHISRRLDQIINHLTTNKEEFRSELQEIKNNFSDSDNEFQQMLEREFARQPGKKEDEIYNQESSRNSSAIEEIPDKYKQVFALVQEGKTGREIAEELELGIRETDMIIKLYQRKADKHARKN